MVKTYTAPDDAEVTCTSCGVEFKSPASTRNRRIACPKCREIIVIENHAEPVSGKKERAPVAPEADGTHNPAETLEARIAALEAAVAALIVAGSATQGADENRKLQWATVTTADPLGAFSPERECALAHNLGTSKAREITFRISPGDPSADGRVGSLMKIFERAGWTVCGPENAAVGANPKSLVLGVPELPVSKEAAETYLALKAAGFEPVPVLDPTLVHADGVASLSLTLPAANRA